MGWLYKAVLVLILKTLVERRQAALPENVVVTFTLQEQNKPEPDPAFATATIPASGVVSSMLHALSVRLERACARNKYGLRESACKER